MDGTTALDPPGWPLILSILPFVAGGLNFAGWR
jgi:hypothetical protein